MPPLSVPVPNVVAASGAARYSECARHSRYRQTVQMQSESAENPLEAEVLSLARRDVKAPRGRGAERGSGYSRTPHLAFGDKR